jgi:hypothetical protein
VEVTVRASCTLTLCFKHTSGSANATGKNIYETAEKSPEQHFEANHSVNSSKTKTSMTRMRAVITLCVSPAKYQIVTLSMNSSVDLHN